MLPLASIQVRANRRPVDPIKAAELARSIEDLGLLNPITVDESLCLIAGAHRIEAHRLLGLKEIDATILPLSPDEAELAEIDENLVRNDLTVLDRAECLARRKAVYERLHPETRTPGRGRNQHVPTEIISIGSFASDTAAKTGVTPRTIRQEVHFATAIVPDVRDALRQTPTADVKTDLISIARMTPEDQRQVVKHIINGSRPQEALRQVRAERIASQPLTQPADKYRIVYADPPWSYGNTQPDYHTEQRDHYPVLSLADICALPVRSWVEDNAVLFLWVTSPILEESFQVIRAWGFQYKTSFVWDKIKHNMGHYNSVRHEFLLVCVRGSCPPDERKLFDSVQTIERGEHSAKPAQFRQIIDTIYPHGRRIELFARSRVQGWETYGYEC